MTEALSLIAGMALGACVCAFLVVAIATVWRAHWGRALVYFGLAEEATDVDDPEDEPAAGLRVGGRALGRGDSFAWPRPRRSPQPHR